MASTAMRTLGCNFSMSLSAVRHRLRLAFPHKATFSISLRAVSTDKPAICTADELHYITAPNSDWRLALWRYHPSPQAPARNHPLLLLSGVGTNAIGYDLSPESSFARYMSGQGFDTWILEVRGSGLSVWGSASKKIEQSVETISDTMKEAAGDTDGASTAKKRSRSIPGAFAESVISSARGDQTRIPTLRDESKLVMKLTETFRDLSERLSGFLRKGQSKIVSAKLLDQISKLIESSQLMERFNVIRDKLSSLLGTGKNSFIARQVRGFSQKLVNTVDGGQQSLSPRLFELQERFNSTVADFQKQLELIVKYDWDFDHYLEEDVPAAIEYIGEQSKPKDGKLLAIGHSMGGILLYAMISQYGSRGRDPRLAAVVTLASSLDYSSSNSTLKLLLPLADPAQALNIPAIPLGVFMEATYPLSSRPPYALSWLNNLISAEDMMHQELLKKLILNSFCTIPTKLLLQLRTAFQDGGLRDRSSTFCYKEHLHKSSVPVLALAGDQDRICPPEAVEETVKFIPEHLSSYKVFGQLDGPHYAHYDLVGGRQAVSQVYPCITEFLGHHDST